MRIVKLAIWAVCFSNVFVWLSCESKKDDLATSSDGVSEDSENENGTDTHSGSGTDDLCPDDPDKTEPGMCGCGVAEGDCGDCPDSLAADEKLLPGEHICSQNGKYRFGLSSDGELALADDSSSLWKGGVFGSAVYLIMQGDGNLVVYNNSEALWASDTHNNPGAFLKVQDDGRAVILRNGQVLWSAPGDGGDEGVGGDEEFTFFAVGDSRTNQEVFGKLISSAVSLDPNVIALFNNGDLTSDGSSDRWVVHMTMLKEGGGGRVRADLTEFSTDAIRYIGAFGNHDDGSANWLNNWNENLSGQKNLGANSTVGVYFSLKYKNAIFIVLDSVHPSSAQKEWLKGQLINAESTNIKWKFVFFHHPVYPCNDKSPFDRGAEDWVSLFEQYHVDIVFVADSHTYERTCPMIMGQCDPNGVVYLNTSGAGAPTRSVHRTKTDTSDDDSYSCSEILQAFKGNWDHYCHFSVTDSRVLQNCYSHNTTSNPMFTWTLNK